MTIPADTGPLFKSLERRCRASSGGKRIKAIVFTQPRSSMPIYRALAFQLNRALMMYVLCTAPVSVPSLAEDAFILVEFFHAALKRTAQIDAGGVAGTFNDLLCDLAVNDPEYLVHDEP